MSISHSLKCFACIGIFLFFIVAVAPTINAMQTVEQNKVLRTEHLPYLIQGYIFLKDSEIKVIVRDVIKEIIKDGIATRNEIQSIIKTRRADVGQIYLLVEVKTIHATDGGVTSVPGYFRSFIGWYSVNGAYVDYIYWEWGDDNGWHLTINDNLVTATKGIIIGFWDEIYNFWYYHIPVTFPWFEINGIGLLVFHRGE